MKSHTPIPRAWHRSVPYAVTAAVAITALMLTAKACSPGANKSSDAQTKSTSAKKSAGVEHAADAQRAARVLERALASNGSHFDFPPYKDPATGKSSSSPDYGLTLDAILTMDSAGIDSARSEKAMAYVGDHVQEYVGDGKTSSSAGATAKALVVALAHRVTPAGTLGGVDLVARLEAREQPSGRFTDKSSSGDFSSTLTQSLALVGLARAKAGPSSNAITYLQKQQCPNGGFRIKMADAACTKNKGVDPDATSYAVQGLLATPKTNARTLQISRAVAYLKTRMSPSGGIKGGTSTASDNANSTGLAVMSFDSAGFSSLASKGREYLMSLRFGCEYPELMRGALAYDDARLKQARSQGSSAKLVDQDLRGTTQAALGLSGKSLLQISNSGKESSAPPKVSC